MTSVRVNSATSCPAPSAHRIPSRTWRRTRPVSSTRSGIPVGPHRWRLDGWNDRPDVRDRLPGEDPHSTSIMSTTGDLAVGQPSPEALGALLALAPTSRDEAIESGVRTAKVIGSPGYPFDEARIRERAASDYDRSFHPSRNESPSTRGNRHATGPYPGASVAECVRPSSFTEPRTRWSIPRAAGDGRRRSGCEADDHAGYGPRPPARAPRRGRRGAHGALRFRVDAASRFSLQCSLIRNSSLLLNNCVGVARNQSRRWKDGRERCL